MVFSSPTMGLPNIVCTDGDSDSYYAEVGCGTGVDCDDGGSAINPGVTEVCDGIDNNCNSQIDEGVKTTYYFYSDLDTYGNNAVNTDLCTVPVGYVTGLPIGMMTTVI